MISISRKRGDLIVQEPVKAFDEDVIKEAVAVVHRLQAKGTLAGGFEAADWVLNSQVKKTTLPFSHRKGELIEACRQAGVNYEDFIRCLKTFIALRIHVASPPNLRSEIRYIIDELLRSRFGTSLVAPRETTRWHDMLYYAEFISIWGVPDEYVMLCRKVLITCREKAKITQKDRQHACVLDEFVSYFKFDEILRTWWKEDPPETLRNLYRPLFLWWVITTIIPLRVMEACVTPFDCVQHKDGGTYSITVRRSLVKGSSAYAPVIRQHEIETDYSLHTYEIPGWLYEEIKGYQALTADYEHPYGLLFSVDYINSLDSSVLRTAVSDKAFGPTELSALIADFYARIVLGQHGLELVDSEDLMSRSVEEGSYSIRDNEIMLIHAKDTRHLAMINLVLRGATPMILREFAVHTNDTADAHYYGNISHTVRCVTRYQYERYKREQSVLKKEIANIANFNLRGFTIDDAQPHIEVDAGDCYSADRIAGGIADCRRVGGDCQKCRYLKRRSRKGAPDGAELDKEMEFFRKMLKSPALDDRLEEFQIRANLLEQHAQDFATQIWRELMQGEKEKEHEYQAP